MDMYVSSTLGEIGEIGKKLSIERAGMEIGLESWSSLRCSGVHGNPNLDLTVAPAS